MSGHDWEMGRASLLIVFVVALVAAAGCGGQAGAGHPDGLLRLNRSIGVVSLGELRSTAEPRLGRSDVLSTRIDRSARPTPARVSVVSYPGAGVIVWWAGAVGKEPRAFILETRSPLYRTAKSVGVGSSLAALRSIGVFCNVGADCQYGYHAPNAGGTTFRLTGPDGRVSEILISYGH